MEKKEVRELILFLLLSAISFLGVCHFTVTGLMIFWAEPMDEYMNILGSVPVLEYLFLGFFLWLLLMTYVLVNCALIIGLIKSLKIIKVVK